MTNRKFPAPWWAAALAIFAALALAPAASAQSQHPQPYGHARAHAHASLSAVEGRYVGRSLVWEPGVNEGDLFFGNTIIVQPDGRPRLQLWRAWTADLAGSLLFFMVAESAPTRVRVLYDAECRLAVAVEIISKPKRVQILTLAPLSLPQVLRPAAPAPAPAPARSPPARPVPRKLAAEQ